MASSTLNEAPNSSDCDNSDLNKFLSNLETEPSGNFNKDFENSNNLDINCFNNNNYYDKSVAKADDLLTSNRLQSEQQQQQGCHQENKKLASPSPGLTAGPGNQLPFDENNLNNSHNYSYSSNVNTISNYDNFGIKHFPPPPVINNQQEHHTHYQHRQFYNNHQQQVSPNNFRGIDSGSTNYPQPNQSPNFHPDRSFNQQQQQQRLPLPTSQHQNYQTFQQQNMPKANEPIKLVYPIGSNSTSGSNQTHIYSNIQQLQQPNSNVTMNNPTGTGNRVTFTSQSLPNGTISITTQPTHMGQQQIMHTSASGIPTSTTIKTISAGGAGGQHQNHPHNMGGTTTQTLVIKNQTVSLPAGLVSSAPSGLVTMTKTINQGNQANIVGNMLPAGVVMGVRANAPNQHQQKGVNSGPLSRVVISNPHMVGSRPNNPGITLSTIQQSGPALILKTENGYQLLRVGPPQPGSGQVGQTIGSNTGNQTIRLQTVPAVSRFTGPSLALRKTIVTQHQVKQKQNSMAASAASSIVVNSVTTSNATQVLSSHGNTTIQQHQPTIASVQPVTSVMQSQMQHHPPQQTQSQQHQPQPIQIQQTIQPVQSQHQIHPPQQQPQQQQHQQQQHQQQQHQQQQHQQQHIPLNVSTAMSGTTQTHQITTTTQQKNLQGNTKEKCRKFLANLIELSTREPKPVERNVRTLIQELIDANVEPEEFCDRLERLLNASPQPCLIGFLKKSLPLLRQSLFTKELAIDGIKPPPQHVVGLGTVTGLQQQFPRIQAQIRPLGQTTTTIGQTQVRMVTQTAPRPIGQTTITKQTIGSGVRIQGPLPTTISGPRLANTQIRPIGAIDTNNLHTTPNLQSIRNQVFQSPQNILTVKAPPGSIRVPGTVQIRSTTPVRAKNVNAAAMAAAAAAGITQVKVGQTQIKQITTSAIQNNLSSNILTPTIPVPTLATLPTTVTTSNSVNFHTTAPTIATSNNNSNLITTTTMANVLSAPKIIPIKAQNTSQSTPKATSKKKQLQEEKAATATSFFQQPSMSTASSMYGDDDINDVAAMGGVNLAEESQKILGSTENIGTQIRSCKDEVFLHLPALQNRIKTIVAEKGLEDPSQEVAVLISHACQERLKNIVEKLAVIAEHRIDILKVDTRYEITKDVRGQVKFLEELDKAEQKRHEEQEREMLFRAAKSRSKIEDPEQAKLKAKAKEMQRAEMEEIRHQESNKTALQAIGPRKKPKLDGDVATSVSPSGSFGVGTTGISSAPYRPRIKRVNLRDMLFFMEQERETCKSSMLYKAFLK